MLNRTVDVGRINSVLMHPDIWPNIADAGQDKSEFEPPLTDVHYLYDEGVLFILHEHEEGLQVHANVVKNHRNKAVQAAQETLAYGFNNLKADKIFCRIPVEYENVYRFASKFLKYEGVFDGEHRLSLRVDEWDSSVT